MMDLPLEHDGPHDGISSQPTVEGARTADVSQQADGFNHPSMMESTKPTKKKTKNSSKLARKLELAEKKPKSMHQANKKALKKVFLPSSLSKVRQQQKAPKRVRWNI